MVLLRTRRWVHRLLAADGRVLAELADDRVTAEPLDEEAPSTSWREIEVELVEGDRALLAAAGKALRAGGAKPAGSASKLARALADRLPAAQPERTTGEPHRGRGGGCAHRRPARGTAGS